MSTTVQIIGTQQVAIIETATNVLELTAAGPQGPQGPAGAPAYVHQQGSASATWTINHNLGYRPSVELLNTGSQEIEGDVVHTSVNQTVVSFSGAVAGQARLI